MRANHSPLQFFGLIVTVTVLASGVHAGPALAGSVASTTESKGTPPLAFPASATTAAAAQSSVAPLPATHLHATRSLPARTAPLAADDRTRGGAAAAGGGGVGPVTPPDVPEFAALVLALATVLLMGLSLERATWRSILPVSALEHPG
jgi:hypothetical protein